MITIYDVAKYAGVSKSTVSLVLNKSPLVKEATRLKVTEAMRTLNYVPNTNARGLGAKATKCIGIVVMTEAQPETSYDFDQRTGICSFNISTGVMSAIMNSDFGAVNEQFCSVDNPGELPNIVKNRRVDGVIIVGSPYDKGMISKLKAMNFPFVMVGVDSYEEGVDSIRSDPGEGVKMGFRYLVETGHKKILFLNCPITYHSAYVREKSLYQCAHEMGVYVDPGWIVNCRRNNGQSAYDCFKQCWESGMRPDAILSANGHLGMGAMRYLYEKNVRVPEDISVFAYEDSSISGYCIPGLTTVNIHKELMGATAAEYLIKRIEDPGRPASEIVIPAEIVLRDSVKNRIV